MPSITNSGHLGVFWSKVLDFYFLNWWLSPRTVCLPVPVILTGTRTTVWDKRFQIFHKSKTALVSKSGRGTQDTWRVQVPRVGQWRPLQPEQARKASSETKMNVAGRLSVSLVAASCAPRGGAMVLNASSSCWTDGNQSPPPDRSSPPAAQYSRYLKQLEHRQHSSGLNPEQSYILFNVIKSFAVTRGQEWLKYGSCTDNRRFSRSAVGRRLTKSHRKKD